MSNTTNTANTASVDTTDKPVILPFSDVLDKYDKADKGHKAAMRAKADNAVKSAIRDGNLELAQRWQTTRDAMTTDIPVKEVDHGQVVAIATIVIDRLNDAISAYRAEHGIQVVPAVSDDSDISSFTDKADNLLKSLMSDRAPKTDTQGTFDKAFQNDAIGTVRKVSDICRLGGKPGGSGAIAARLTFRANGTMHLDTDKCTLVGFEPVWVDESGSGYVGPKKSETHRLGARKTA